MSKISAFDYAHECSNLSFPTSIQQFAHNGASATLQPDIHTFRREARCQTIGLRCMGRSPTRKMGWPLFGIKRDAGRRRSLLELIAPQSSFAPASSTAKELNRKKGSAGLLTRTSMPAASTPLVRPVRRLAVLRGLIYAYTLIRLRLRLPLYVHFPLYNPFQWTIFGLRGVMRT